MVAGLAPLVDRVQRTTTKERQYHLQGFRQLAPGIFRGCCVASIAGWVSDAMIASMLEDSRVAMKLPELEAAVQEDISWLEALEPIVWRRLQQALGQGL